MTSRNGRNSKTTVMDVEVERAIKKKIQKFVISEFENKLWALDQRINDRGVRLQPTLFKNAIECDEQYKEKLMSEAGKITGLSQSKQPCTIKGLAFRERLRNGQFDERYHSSSYLPGTNRNG
jgi:hypothetical protein